MELVTQPQLCLWLTGTLQATSNSNIITQKGWWNGHMFTPQSFQRNVPN